MIKTTTEELNRKFIITDDVNSENLEFIKNHYKKSILKINRRFDTPTPDYTAYDNMQSNTYKEVWASVEIIYDLMQKGATSIVQGETPFKNFKIKINYWCNTQFKDVLNNLDKKVDTYIIIDTTITKHEYIFLYWLYSCGANIVVITKDIKKAGTISDDIQLNIYNTNENLEYKEEILENQITYVDTNELKTLNDVESALYDKNNLIKLSVVGVDSYIDSCDFCGKIYIESNTNDKIKLIVNKFEAPAQDEINRIPRFKKDEHNYILQTLLMFVNLNDKDKQNKLKECIQTEFNSGDNRELKGTMLYNKLVYCILVLNKLLNSNAKHIVVYYNKEISKNDINIISILSILDFVSIILITTDKSLDTNVLIPRLEFKSSVQGLDLPTVDSRSNVRTTGAVASRIAQETLYTGDLLGMYKPGQFYTCDTKLFSTAYEEIELWWNKELYNRPQFKADGIKVTLPVMFKVIKGVPDTIKSTDYVNGVVQKYLYGNTIICRNVQEIQNLWGNSNMRILRGTDIYNTKFEDQKPFYTNGKLEKQRIKSGINYTYGFLSTQKQDFILDKIEELLNSEYIIYSNKSDFTDDVLSILLSLNNDLVRMIQWFEFYTDNPNLVLIMPNEGMLSIKETIMLVFLHMIGFDILIFTPTCYKTLDDLVTPKFQYETHNIGYAVYDINTQYIQLGNQIVERVQQAQSQVTNKKKGFFSRLLGG